VDLLKLFHREPEGEDPETRIDPHGQRTDDVVTELHDLVVEQLVRGGVLEDCVAVEIRALGESKDGRKVYVGMMRLLRWEQTSALRVLLGLPLLQARVRKAVRSGWLDEVALFSGLWLHPSGQFEDSSAMNDLRAMILHLEQAGGAGWQGRPGGDARAQQSVWSVPQDLDGADRDSS
jgi:hypothetical protein